MFPQSHNFSLQQMLHHHHHHQHHLPISPHMPTPIEQHHQQQHHSRWKPSIEVAPNCPRCASTNTKFCYYNNYSLSQPRYFCKGCRRYWTKGGSLRNVPVGGGCRKNRRGKSSSRHQQQTSNINSVSDDTESSSSSARALHQTNLKESRDIDMALVFAKFLNPKTSTAPDDNNGSSSSNNYLTPESVESESDAVVQPQNMSLSSDPDPVVAESENFRGDDELSLSGIHELERLLGVCGDDEDGLWSDATLSSSVTWQPSLKQMQFHDFDLEYSIPLNEDHQLLPINSESAMSDTSCWTNWNSFDLSTMQLFSSTP